jgi:hypothetical protein
VNRIVRHHYPVARLPDDIRRELGDIREVTLTLDVPDDVAGRDQHEGTTPLSFEEIFASRKPPFRSAEEIVAEIREGRDDDR